MNNLAHFKTENVHKITEQTKTFFSIVDSRYNSDDVTLTHASDWLRYMTLTDDY